MKTKLSVIGLGKLGSPMLAVFAQKGFDVIGMDLNKTFVDQINAGVAPVAEPQLQEFISANRERIRATTDIKEATHQSDVSFIIVPTPSGENKMFRNDYVISALEGIGDALRSKDGYHNVVVTSTVMPGATGGVLREALERASGRTVGENVGLCYNPEFIALGTVVRDMCYPDMILIGESDPRAGEILEAIYRESTDSSPDFQRMNWVNAELCKIAVNTYVTTKISYANMIADMCDRLPNADADVVTNALGADSRIGRKYIKGGVAYGGPCFPRDNKAFSALGRELGARTDLAEATDAINDYQTERLLDAITSVQSSTKRVAILGLSYKPNTPVTEESQGLGLARDLAARGFTVSISDPQALADIPDDLPSEIIAEESLGNVIQNQDILVLMTPWEHYKTLEQTLARLAPAPQAIVDPWRLLRSSAELADETRLIQPGLGNWRS